MTRTYSWQCCVGLQDERDTAPRCAGASRPRGDGRTPAWLQFVPGSGCQSSESSGRRLCALIFCDGGQGLPGHQPGVLLSIRASRCEVLPGGAQSCTSFHLLSGSRVHRVPLLASVYPRVQGSEAVTVSSEKPCGN